jgi:cytochrome c553
MKVKVNQLKKFAIALITLPLLTALMLNSAALRTRAASDQPDAAELYKTNKCSICHGEKAEKKFDATKPDDQLVDTIMKGKKGEKPPFMPSFEAKGLTADQAKTLAAYMKSLKQ